MVNCSKFLILFYLNFNDFNSWFSCKFLVFSDNFDVDFCGNLIINALGNDGKANFEISGSFFNFVVWMYVGVCEVMIVSLKLRPVDASLTLLVCFCNGL